ncbi:MAG: pacearchaeosortase [Candidatus Woesearchaeota archaeon]
MKYPSKLILRLAIAILLGIFYKLFYLVFAPLTLYPAFYLIRMMTPATLSGIMLYIPGYTFSFIDACAAASAYLLLSYLILLTMDISIKKRVAMFLSGSALILAFNIFRIWLLFYILLNFGMSAFQAVHMFIWKFLATLYVLAVWIFLIRAFKVKSIPIYSDYKYLYSRAKLFMAKKKAVKKIVQKRKKVKKKKPSTAKKRKKAAAKKVKKKSVKRKKKKVKRR